MPIFLEILEFLNNNVGYASVQNQLDQFNCLSVGLHCRCLTDRRPDKHQAIAYTALYFMRYDVSRAIKWSTVGEASAKCEISFLFTLYLYYIMKALYEH